MTLECIESSGESKWLIDLGFPICFINKYFVPDYPRCKVLILESPHLEEVENGYPLAGTSGKRISEIISKNSDVPYGKLLYKERDVNVGVINVCQIPMQFKAYCYQDLIQLTSENLIDLNILFQIKIRFQKEKLKNPPQIICCQTRINLIFEMLVKSLSERIKGRNTLACGWVAMNFLSACAHPASKIKHPGRPLDEASKQTLSNFIR